MFEAALASHSASTASHTAAMASLVAVAMASASSATMSAPPALPASTVALIAASTERLRLATTGATATARASRFRPVSADAAATAFLAADSTAPDADDVTRDSIKMAFIDLIAASSSAASSSASVLPPPIASSMSRETFELPNLNVACASAAVPTNIATRTVTMLMSMEEERTHAVLPWLLIWPKPHATHAPAPAPLMVSSAHATQVETAFAATTPEAVPAGHASHSVALATRE